MMYLWRNDPANRRILLLGVTHPKSEPLVQNVLNLHGNVLAGNPSWIDPSIKTVTFAEWLEEHFDDLDRYRFPAKSTERARMIKALVEIFAKVNAAMPAWLEFEYLQSIGMSKEIYDTKTQAEADGKDPYLEAFAKLPETKQPDCHPRCGAAHPTKIGPHIHHNDCPYRAKLKELLQ